MSLSPFVRVFVRPYPFFSFSVFEVCSTFECHKASKSFNGVLRVFQESFKGVSRKFQSCFKEVSRAFQGSFKEVSRVFQGRIKDVS